MGRELYRLVGPDRDHQWWWIGGSTSSVEAVGREGMSDL